MNALTPAVSSQAKCPAEPGNSFHVSYTTLLYSFSVPSERTPGLWEEGVSAPFPVVGLCGNHHLLKKEVNLVKVERFTN